MAGWEKGSCLLNLVMFFVYEIIREWPETNQPLFVASWNCKYERRSSILLACKYCFLFGIVCIYYRIHSPRNKKSWNRIKYYYQDSVIVRSLVRTFFPQQYSNSNWLDFSIHSLANTILLFDSSVSQVLVFQILLLWMINFAFVFLFLTNQTHFLILF